MRKCVSWIDGYQAYTANQESPPVFHRWVGLTVLSTVLGRRVMVDHGAYQVHPNLFTILVGPSALVKKTTAIGLGKKLLDGLQTPTLQIVPQYATPEAFVRDLAHHTDQHKGEAMTLICAPELVNFLRIKRKTEESTMIPLLTELWDGYRPWRATTIKRGNEEIEWGNVSFLAGTTREWLLKAIPTATTAGGFTGRCIFVEAEDGGKRIPYPTMSPESKRVAGDLIHDLAQIAKLKGVYTLTDAARLWYGNWYSHELPAQLKALPSEEVAGFYGRIHDHTMKVAMILAASTGDRLVIEESHLVQAREWIADIEPRQQAVTQGMASTPFGEDCRRVIDFVRSRGGFAGWSEILRHMSQYYTAKDLNEKVMRTLLEAGTVEYVTRGITPAGTLQQGGYRLLGTTAPYMPTVGLTPPEPLPQDAAGQNGVPS